MPTPQPATLFCEESFSFGNDFNESASFHREVRFDVASVEEGETLARILQATPWSGIRPTALWTRPRREESAYAGVKVRDYPRPG